MGVVTQAGGTSQSAYGFTGEMSDASGLTHLRARYYNPADGRFQSRDTWGGDYNRPLSLNRWMYVEGNPVNKIDPSGNIPTINGIKRGDYVYSCNCGWIDFTHAGPDVAADIIELLEYGNQTKPPYAWLRDDVYLISPEVDIVGPNPYLDIVVNKGASKQDKESIALGIYRKLQEHVEDKEGLAFGQCTLWKI